MAIDPVAVLMAVIIPTLALPFGTPFTDHTTPTLEEPVTVAVYVVLAPACKVKVGGSTLTATCEGVIVNVAGLDSVPEVSSDAAVIETSGGLGTVAGAV